MALWRGITAGMMSDEEDGAQQGLSGWIVWPPSRCSQEPADLCATLQQRPESDPKHTDRTPPNVCDPRGSEEAFQGSSDANLAFQTTPQIESNGPGISFLFLCVNFILKNTCF